ncbi:50S ribosomal protein L4, partial [Thermoactinomyces vulgaris]
MSLEINVKNASGAETGKTIELPASIFDVEPNIPLMHQVVTAQLAAARTG